MKSVRRGLRDGELSKDTFERLHCEPCDEELKTQNDPSEIGSVRICPQCEKKWKEIR